MATSLAIPGRGAATAIADPLPAVPRHEALAPAPSAADLSDLVGRIYDAAFDPGLWPGALRELSGFSGGWGAAILSKEPTARAGALLSEDGTIDREWINRYFSDYVRLDMHNLAHCLAEVGEPVVSSGLGDFEEFARSRFYEEWVSPQRLIDFVAVPFERGADGTSILGVHRREEQGFADAEMRRRLALIGPHINRAVQAGRAMERAAATAASLADTLDGLAAGVFLLDDEGRLAHANASGRAMLKERSVVDLRGGRLAPREEAHGLAFRAAAAEAARGDAATGAFDIDLAFEGRDGEAHLAQVLPLADGQRRRLGARLEGQNGAVAAVFVRPAAPAAPSSLKALADRFDLTPTEVKVLVALAEVGGVPEVADALGIAVSTVKTHVHRLLGKTGASRQADLVRLLAGYSARLLR